MTDVIIPSRHLLFWHVCAWPQLDGDVREDTGWSGGVRGAAA